MYKIIYIPNFRKIVNKSIHVINTLRGNHGRCCFDFDLTNFSVKNYIEKYWTRISAFSVVGLEFLKILLHEYGLFCFIFFMEYCYSFLRYEGPLKKKPKLVSDIFRCSFTEKFVKSKSDQHLTYGKNVQILDMNVQS